MTKLEEENRTGKKFEPKGDEKPPGHRDPILAQASYEQAGSTYESQQLEVSKIGATKQEDEGNKLLGEILQELKNQNGFGKIGKVAAFGPAAMLFGPSG